MPPLGSNSSQAPVAAEVSAIGHAGHPSPPSRQERCAIAPRNRLSDQAGLGPKNNRPSDAFKAFNFAVCCHGLRSSTSTLCLCHQVLPPGQERVVFVGNIAASCTDI
jgi:hypothetical protein